MFEPWSFSPTHDIKQMSSRVQAMKDVLSNIDGDTFGSSTAFIGLAGIAALGLTVIWLFMPETRRTG